MFKVRFPSGLLRLKRISPKELKDSEDMVPVSGFDLLQVPPYRLKITGLLHLGGFRTALVNYLFAVKHDGKFILRIEDTDQARLVPDAIKKIEEDLSWLELTPDEGPSKPGSHGPYIQSQRVQLYQENIGKLIDSGSAYECFCSETRIDLVRREALKQRQRPRYDNKCRDLTREQVKAKKVSGEKYCIRFKLQPEKLRFNDLVYGPIDFDMTENNYEGDPVVVKADGFPTYHFANVVDDHFMEISHVLRGVEWQVSTPKHLQMYRAFNWASPEFAHLPLIVNKDGTKLSKRQGDVSISHYKDQMYYPKALTNFVTKSGGGFADHGVDSLYNSNQLAELFELSKVNTSACRLDFALLSQLNQLELKDQIERNFDGVVSALRSKTVSSAVPNFKTFTTDYLEKIVKWCPERVNTVCDLVNPSFSYLWSQPGPDSVAKISSDMPTLNSFIIELEKFLSNTDSEFFVNDKSKVSSFMQDYATANELKFKLLMRDIRLALCGIEKGPPIADVIQLFGKQATIVRLREAITLLSQYRENADKAVNR